MYCPKCGNEVAEGLDFCTACGTKISRIGASKIDVSTPFMSGYAPVPQNALKRKKIGWVIAAVALILVIAVGVGSAFWLGKSGKLEGKFYSLGGKQDVCYEFIPSKTGSDAGTIKITQQATGYKASGVYSLSNQTLTIEVNGVKQNAILSGGYISFESGILEGELPQSDRFNATFQYKEALMTQTTTFNKDGTYSSEMFNGTTRINFSGTYKRIGDKMVLNQTKGADVATNFEIVMLIYGDHLAKQVLCK